MKNLKFSLFAMVLTIVALSFTSCGDESKDPQPLTKEEPAKTNLELVKKGIIGTWELQSIVVTDGDVTQTFNGGCDESGYTQAIKANLEDIDFKFTSSGKVSIILNCQAKTVDETYAVTEANGKFLVKTGNGWEFELVTPTNDLSKKTIKANALNKLQNVETCLWTFTLK